MPFSSNKKKRYKKATLCPNKYKEMASSSARSSKRKRLRYFKTFRSLRTALNILENIFPNRFNHKEYRAFRYAYYFIIPLLEKYLWYGPDRDRLREVEHDYHGFMLSHIFRSESALMKEPKRLFIRSFRSSIHEVDTIEAKL